MITIDPQQELFTGLLLGLRKTRYDVHDTFLPPPHTPYPFFYLADSRQNDTQTKNAVHGTIYQTIHVWHNNPKQRGTVSEMLLTAKRICYQFEQEHSGWVLQNIEQRILPDNTTKTPLLHGVLEVGIRFS